MKLHRTPPLLVACLLAAPCAPGLAQRLARPLLSVNSVVLTLRNAGLTVDAQQVAIPSGLTAAEEQPALAVESAELQRDRSLRIRIACVHHADCSPFYATITLSSQGAGMAALEALRPATAQAEPTPARTTAVIRPGEQTSLLLEDRQMRISLPVIAIDSGSVGTEVRVVSLDHKTTFRTVVVSPTLVRGVLP